MSAASLAGRTFLVTGATDGIGAHTAQRLAAQGGTVLVHGRSPERVEAALQRVQQAGGTGHAGFVADLSSLQQVRRLAELVTQAHPQLDVLVNNAGVYEQKLLRSEVRRASRLLLPRCVRAEAQPAPCQCVEQQPAPALPCPTCRTGWR